MKVRIQVEFEIETDVEDDDLTEEVAKEAARHAAWHYLAFCPTGFLITEEVEVHVEGFGECRVKLCEGEVEA